VRRGKAKDGTAPSKAAIEAGMATAEVFNNLGYALERTGQPDKALDAFNRSLTLKPGLQPALYNRAWTEFRRARAKGQPVDDQASKDIEEAVNSNTATAYMFYDAALIYSRLGEDPRQYRTQVVEHLCHALRLGADPKVVRRVSKSFIDDANLEKALALNVPVVRRSVADHLADPLPGQPFPFR